MRTQLNLTKVVATIGPASENMPVLPKVVEAGMRIMRLNFSHATYDEANLRVANLRKSPGLTSKSFNLRNVMLDTQGPEIRTGSFGKDGSIDLVEGAKISLTTDDAFRTAQTANKIWISYKGLFDAVKEKNLVLIEDGNIQLVVDSKDKAAGLVHCTALNSGSLGSRKGVNLPGARIGLPAMDEKDRKDIRWGIQNDIDCIAVSFVRKPQDLIDIRQYCAQLLKEFKFPAEHPGPMLIAKIESTEGMENFDAILEEADGIMVARGDLGVEIPIWELANAQKDIVRKSNLAGKPVVVATQMLESMIKNPRPTRAECTDVANAVFDGADCVMLSGESAKGKYPVGSVSMMNKIITEAEKRGMDNDVSHTPAPAFDNARDNFALGVAEASDALNASCIIVLSKSGATAKALSKFRPNVPIVTFVPNQKQGRMLQLYRGIHPILAEDATLQSRILSSDPSRYSIAVNYAASVGFCQSGDKVIVVAGEKEDKIISSSFSMHVATVN